MGAAVRGLHPQGWPKVMGLPTPEIMHSYQQQQFENLVYRKRLIATKP